MDYTTIQNASTKIVDNIKVIDGSINTLQNKQDIISTSDMSMANSHDGKLKIEEIGGKCEQASMSGAQLFDRNNANYVENISFNVSSNPYHFVYSGSDNHSRVYYVSVQPSTTYTISKELGSFFRVGTCKDIPIDGGIVTTVNDDTSKNVATITTGQDDMYVAFYPLLVSEITTIGYDAVIEKVMLNTGSTSLPYEPYTGGIPAPNPDYPQEIKKVVISEVKTHGKNILNHIVSSRTTSGLDVKASKEIITVSGTNSSAITISVCDTTIKNTKGLFVKAPKVRSGINYIARVHRGDSISYLHVLENGLYIPAGGDIGRLYLQQNTVNTTIDLELEPQIVEGFEDSIFEPYTESIVKLSQPIELYGIGDVKDTIEDGKVVRRFTSVVLDGTKNVSRAPQEKDNTTYRFYISDAITQAKIKKYASNKVPDMFSDMFVSKSADVVYWSGQGISVDSNGTFQVYHEKFNNYTIEQMREFLSNTPVNVVYPLSEPVIEPLPSVDQAALNSLSTYDTITYVDFDSEIEPTFQAEYGVTEMGGRVLEDLMTGLASELLAQSDADRITALESTIVNNI